MSMATERFDSAVSEQFAGRMVEVLNNAAVALMASIGHQVGLFDALADRPPATSEDIAQTTGLDERYIREWLSALTVARIIDYDPAGRTFSLPREHAAWLTRAAGPNNLAAVTQFIPLLAQVEEPIIGCFRTGGGVPYSAYRQFQRLMAEDSAAVHDAALTSSILPLVAGLPERLRSGIDVADVGCGSGHAINLMAQNFPRSRFVGYDLSAEGIAAARREAQALGLANATFEESDVAELDLHDRFDLVTAFDAIHDQAHPASVLKGIADMLRPDGVFLMVDIQASSDLAENQDLPMAPFLYTVSTLHCMTVSLARGGVGLGTMWGEQRARQLLSEAGFTRVDVARIEDDLFNNYFIATKS